MLRSKGILEVNGILLGPDTCIDEVMAAPGFHTSVNGSVDISSSEQADIGGHAFHVTLIFTDKKLAKIKLVPANLGIKEPGHPDKKYQEEKKKAADVFLQENLGNPSKESEAVKYYEYDWGSVSSVAFLGGRNEYAGGFIEIAYGK